MSLRQILFLALLCCFAFSANAVSPEKTLQMKENERAMLIEYLENMRDSIQLLTTRYYTLKQHSVDQRESDKAEYDKLREQQERLNGDVARLREETLTREQNLDEQKKNVEQKQDELKALSSTIEDMFKKEADGIIESFPLDREVRRQSLESIRGAAPMTYSPGVALKSLMAHKLRYIALGESLIMVKQRTYPDEGEPKNMTIARFGNLFGYGTDTSGTFYIIRQTGRLGAARYAIEPATAPELSGYLRESFPVWLNSGKPVGTIMLDVLQNDQSRQLMTGKREGYWTSLYLSLEKGGWGIMIPMFILGLWALYIGVRKWIQLMQRTRMFRRQYTKTMQLLEKKDFDGALSFARLGKGLMARVLQTCIERRNEERHVAERWVRDLIMQEIPIISRGINTVAVIAGAAPLLGLLGTISGMITLFAAVTHHGTGDPKFLAGGISEALITAKTGLAIAIPALFLHDYLRNSKERLVAEIERWSIMIMNLIWPEE